MSSFFGSYLPNARGLADRSLDQATQVIDTQLKSLHPMLAVTLSEKLLRFPYLASPKLDGIRCLVLDGHARTRT